MLKFNKVLLASDFDNTLVYTQGALERGEDITPMSARRGVFSMPSAASIMLPSRFPATAVR